MNSQAPGKPDATGTAEPRIPRESETPSVALEVRAQESARLRLALREAHHRCGNQWQLLFGLAELERRHSPQTKGMGCSMRLYAMIHAFTTLNRALNTDTDVFRGSQKVNVRAILEGSLVQMCATTGEEGVLSFTVQETWLSERGGAALLLSCAELVCNAIKYGRKVTQVTFHIQGEQGVLEVRDDGPGFPEGFRIDEQAGQGLHLVQALCRFDLNAKMRCHNEAQGAVVTLTFPLLSVLDVDTVAEAIEDLRGREGIECFEALP